MQTQNKVLFYEVFQHTNDRIGSGSGRLRTPVFGNKIDKTSLYFVNKFDRNNVNKFEK